MIRRIAVARPVDPSMSTIAPASRTSPVATSNGVGTNVSAVTIPDRHLPAQYPLVRAVMPDVANECRALRKDLFVGRRHVGVRARDGRSRGP